MCCLQDDEQVTRYLPVCGTTHNVYFWNHDHPQGGSDDSKSKVNPVEAEMAGRLACMVQHGYPPGQVIILTPYVGLLRLIRRAVARPSLRRMEVIVSDTDAEQLARRVRSKWVM